MRLLLDTHFALWLTQGGGNLTEVERRTVEAHSADVMVSTVSIWEVRLKWHGVHTSGARKGTADPADVLATMIGMGFAMLPLLPGHAIAVLDVPLSHGDPFDELLLAQAQVEGLRLLTRDPELRGHPPAF